MRRGRPARSAGILTVVAALLLDQLSKAVVTAHADGLAGGLPVFSGFNLVLHRNDGITFGLFGQVPWWALTGVALTVTAWLFLMMWRTTRASEATAYGLIAGGALGNVIDRVRFGAVTDFLDFHLGAYHWPAFNLADVAVVTGAALIVGLPIASKKPRMS
ncbi:signal peptidase II [Palleronia marisminoris]|uniref:signal peptidase II n=1 Tax=Palleronia marisminoris TaxID=315423 RepID=UPI0008E62953|nr:signal peptidase II [Palleronia marisminoris]SFH28855.1 signal peptidase II [Palleronia marisminoris]